MSKQPWLSSGTIENRTLVAIGFVPVSREMADVMLRLAKLLMLIAFASACDSDNCQKFHFNGVDDDEAISQLQKFLSTKVGDNDISIMTNIQMECATLEGSFSPNTAGSDDVTSVTSMQTEQATLEGDMSTIMVYGDDVTSVTSIQTEQATLEGDMSTIIVYGDDVTSIMSKQTEHATLEGDMSTIIVYDDDVTSIMSKQTEHATLEGDMSTIMVYGDDVTSVTSTQTGHATLEGGLSTTIEYGDDVTSITSRQTEHATLEGASSTTMEYGNGAISATTIQMDQTITEITKTEAATTNSLLVGWEKAGRTYYKCFNDRKMTYVQAKANCTGYNGRLAAETLRDPVAARNISSHCLKSASTECLWIGYDDIIKEGQWIWSDGGATTNATTQWADNQPDNYTGTEDCGCIVQRFHKGLFINDNPCEAELNFVCEVPRK